MNYEWSVDLLNNLFSIITGITFPWLGNEWGPLITALPPDGCNVLELPIDLCYLHAQIQYESS